jgi:hypothetical protein
MGYNETTTKGVTMHRFIDNLTREAEENPTMTLVAGAALFTSLSKLISAHGQAVGSRAYAKDVARRVKNSK